MYNWGGRGGLIQIKKKKTKENNNTIYISIPCLGYDPELINTIETAYNNAKDPNNINIGISFTGNKSFYEEITNKYPKIKTKYYTYEENSGVGNGRISALSMYDNEDYFLQIDSHSNFSLNWDKYLIDRYIEAKSIFNSDKIVFSGVLPNYEYIGKRIVSKKQLRYPLYAKDNFMSGSIPWTYAEDPYDIGLYDILKETGFLPLIKIAAGFMFGSKYLANNLGISKEIIFWEEEVLQTINLIDSGFIMVYPGKESAISHFYIPKDRQRLSLNKDGDRESVFSIIKNTEQAILKNYYSFILNPKNEGKVKRYEEYANIDLLLGPKDEGYYPDSYVNYIGGINESS